MWSLTTTINYEVDEKEYTLDYDTAEAIEQAIGDTIERETEALSFVFVVSKP